LNVKKQVEREKHPLNLFFADSIFRTVRTKQEASIIGRLDLRQPNSKNEASMNKFTILENDLEITLRAFKRVGGTNDLRPGWYIPIQAVENLA
jgi:hypothetical protein